MTGPPRCCARPGCDHEPDVAPARRAWCFCGSLLVLEGWPLAATVLEATRAPQRLDRHYRRWGSTIGRSEFVACGASSPSPPRERALDPAATAQLLRESGGLARPARLAVETLGLVANDGGSGACRRAYSWPCSCSAPTSGAEGCSWEYWASRRSCPCPCTRRPGWERLAMRGECRRSGCGPYWSAASGAAIIHALACLPWVVFLVGVGLRTIEPELEESAELDMPVGRVWSRVTLRGAVGAIAAAAVAVAVLTAGDMTVTDLLQVRTYAEEAYVQFTLGRGPADAAVVSVPPLIILGGSIVLVARSLVRADPARLASAFVPARRWKLGRWRVAAGALLLALVGNLAALPLYSLVWRRPGGWAGPARSTADLVARGPAGNTRLRRRRELGAHPDQPDPGSRRGDGHGRPGLGAGLGQPAFFHLAGAAAGDTGPDPGHARPGRRHGTRAGLSLVPADLRLAFDRDHGAVDPHAALCGLDSLACRADPSPASCWNRPSWTAMAPGASSGTWFCRSRPALAAAWCVAFVLGFGELPATNLLQPPGITTITFRIWTLLHTGVESHLAGVALVTLAVIAAAACCAVDWTQRPSATA